MCRETVMDFGTRLKMLHKNLLLIYLEGDPIAIYTGRAVEVG